MEKVKVKFFTIGGKGGITPGGETEAPWDLEQVERNLKANNITRRGGVSERYKIISPTEVHVFLHERKNEPIEDLDTTDNSTAEDQTTTEEPQ